MEYANTAMSFMLGDGLISQLVFVIVAMLAFYAVITFIESIVDQVKKVDRQTTVLFQDTTPTRQFIEQSPGAENLIYNSENEVNGMEFSYSMYLMISPETFEATVSDVCGTTKSQNPTKLRQIFHKGSKDGFPLLAPGLFVHGNKNTLRLYMNSATKWDNYVEIPNIPIGKWFHLVIVLKGKYLDVFVNGNVTVRHEFPTVPKLNYGNVYVLTPVKFPKYASDTVNVGDYTVDGAAKGMVSRLKYYSYALNYSQIDSLYREGPSKKIVSSSFTEVPPYFHDDWWVTKY
jgi:hypothetical protein